MNRIASVSLLGIALAVVLALGAPGKTNAFTNSNCTNSCMILAGGLDISIGDGGVGVGINSDRPDRDREYENQRAYDRERAYEQDQARQRDHEQRRDYNRDNVERTYDNN